MKGVTTAGSGGDVLGERDGWGGSPNQANDLLGPFSVTHPTWAEICWPNFGSPPLVVDPYSGGLKASKLWRAKLGWANWIIQWYYYGISSPKVSQLNSDVFEVT